MIETLSRKRLKQIENIFAKWREDGTSFNFDDVYFNYYTRIIGKEKVKEAFSGSCYKASGVRCSHFDKDSKK